MGECRVFCFLIVLVLAVVHGVNGEDPYRFFTWKVTYGDIYPLGVKQQVLNELIFLALPLQLCFFFFLLCWSLENASCFLKPKVYSFARFFFFFWFSGMLEWKWEMLQGILINGQFPGPQIDAVTNENLVINVFNYLREPFLISW